MLSRSTSRPPREGVEHAVRRAVPVWHEINSLQAIPQILLASLVQHERLLREHLTSDHPTFNNAIFVSLDLDTFRKLLANKSRTSLTVMGVPVHISIVRMLARLTVEVSKTAVAGTDGSRKSQGKLEGD